MVDLEIAFKILKEANLQLNSKKCNYFQTEVKLLRRIVGHNTFRVEEEKIEAVRNWLPPRNAKLVQQFI